jgi:hypothetical protein
MSPELVRKWAFGDEIGNIDLPVKINSKKRPCSATESGLGLVGASYFVTDGTTPG